VTGPSPERPKPALLVLASTYPRWKGDHEPGFVHELCKRLVPCFDVTVLTPDAARSDGLDHMDGVAVVRFRYAPRRLQTLVHDGGMLANLRAAPWKWVLLPAFLGAMVFAAWRQLRRDGADIVHAHWIVPQGLAAVMAQGFQRRKRPLLITSHGADLFALDSRSMRALKRMVASSAAAITVVSEAMRAKARAIGMDDARMSIQPMGVDTDRFSPDLSVERSTSRLLFVGRLVEKKGVRYLLEAMPSILAQVPGSSLTIAGFGPGEAALREQARHLGLDGRVEFLGAVPQQDLPGLYRSAAALVVPFVEAEGGDQEGLGLVMVEALACGCPVVTTSIPAVREVFGGEWPEFCATPASADLLAAEVVRLLRDPARAVAGVRALQPTLRERFGWDGVAHGYAELLFGLLAR
jgi:glycosyltransferase involved in cell wall biosynthesis